MKKRTKILATIGPASDSLEKIEALVRAGVNVFRLNFSHGTHEHHYEILQRIRRVEQKTGLLIGVLQDISGPKIRIGTLEAPFNLMVGDTIEFVKDEIIGTQIMQNSYTASINQDSIFKQLNIGEYIYLCDGMIRTKVTEISPAAVRVVVENDGVLSSKKGINFPNTRLFKMQTI